MSAGVVASQMAIIFVFMAMGYTLTKKGKFSDVTAKDMTFLMVNICCPAMMLSGVLSDQTVTPDHLLTMGGVTVVVYGVLIAVGAVMGRLLRAGRQEYVNYKLMTVFGNIGFIGYPVVTAVVGPQGMPYAVLFNLGFNLLFYTYGVLSLGRSGEEGRQAIPWRRMVNPGTVCGVLSLLVLSFRPPVPGPVVRCLDYLGSILTYMTVALIGHTLAQIPLGEVFRDVRIYLFVALRCVLVPAVLGVVMKQVIHDSLMVQVTVLLLAMPVANMPLVLAAEFGKPTETLTKGIVVSTVLSVVTVVLATSLGASAP